MRWIKFSFYYGRNIFSLFLGIPLSVIVKTWNFAYVISKSKYIGRDVSNNSIHAISKWRTVAQSGRVSQSMSYALGAGHKWCFIYLTIRYMFSIYPWAIRVFVSSYCNVCSYLYWSNLRQKYFIYFCHRVFLDILKFLKTLLQVQNDNDIFDDRKKSHSHNATTLRERLFFMRFIFPTPDIKPLPRWVTGFVDCTLVGNLMTLLYWAPKHCPCDRSYEVLSKFIHGNYL